MKTLDTDWQLPMDQVGNSIYCSSYNMCKEEQIEHDETGCNLMLNTYLWSIFVTIELQAD